MGKQGGKQDKSSDLAGNVVVAVKASKDMHKTALEWALTHVVQPGNRVTLLVVVCSHCYGRRFWGFSFFAGDCASGHGRCHSGATEEQKSDITDCCSQMILQLHDVYDPKKINVKIKIVSGTPCGAVAVEAKRASWVILDKHLKHEAKHCMEELKCNVAVMRHSQAKVLRLNLVELPAKEPESMSSEDHTGEKQENKANSLSSTHGPVVTPSSSSELSTPTEAKTSSASSSGPGTSPFFITEKENTLKTEAVLETKQARDLDESSLHADCKSLSSSSCSTPQRMKQIVSSHNQSSDHLEESPVLSSISMHSATKDILKKLSGFGEGAGFGSPSYKSYLDFNGNLREVISMLRPAPPGPPPLCSICQRKAPVLGKPPRWFTYAELELATGGFSQANFLAEGGFGSVHRGVLPDGQTVAVKQHKLASCQGDQEFCSEVEVLSCAQHRNVVMLIGFCIEDGRRLLVYEYICNGSLDYHLYGEHHNTLSWTARQKIAVGAARGLRYLHEECRVGCIVHRDMRPNNILITHDFESLVGDFGLARWQPDGQTGVETRVIGTFGYLAPEYTQSGQITEKADVYSFGVVLLELVTGRKAVELNRPKGQQCLTEWARSLLEAHADNELVDPRLGSNYSENEVYCMMHAAALCIHRDPHTRPRMSQVLRILEGDMMDSVHLWTNTSDVHQLKYGRSCSVESTDTA